MPWHVTNKAKGCSGYAVVKDDNGEVVGCHPNEKDAVAQLRALYASETNKSIHDGSLWDGFFLPETD